MTPALRAARVAVGLAAVLLPLTHAALRAAVDGAAWPTVTAIAAGLLVRLLAGAAPGVAVALAVAPLWPLLMRVGGTPGDFDRLMPWLAGLAAVLAWPYGRPWHAEGLWGGAIAGWALVLALVTPVVAARELDFSLAAASAPNDAGIVVMTGLAQLVALLLFDWYWSATSHARRRVWTVLLPGIVAAAALALWQQQVDAAFLSGDPWIALRRASSTLLDANATAAFLALVGPIVVTSAVRPAVVPRVAWGAVWYALCLAGIIATGSRSALAAFTLVLGMQAMAASRTIRWLALAAGLLLVAAVVAADRVIDASMGHAIVRLADTVRGLWASGAEGVWRLAWDRDGYGPAAMAMIVEHPVVGTGPGTFGSLVTGYAREAIAVALPPDNAQNWWRQQAAELGLAGSLPAFACSLLALSALAQALVRREDAAAAAPLAGLGLLALVAPPMPHPLLQVMGGLVIAHAVTAAPAAAGTAARPRDGHAIWLLALVCAAGAAVTGWQDLRPAYRAARFHTPYSYGVTPVGPTPYGPGRWMDRRAVAVVDPGSHRTLVARVIVPHEHEDAATRPVRVVVSGRRGVVCVHEAVDAAPFDCRLPVPPDEWPMVRVEIDGASPAAGATRRVAVVNAWLDD